MHINKILSTLMILLLVAAVVTVRLFQEDLFYDPLNEYFHINFQQTPYPEMYLWKIMVSNSLRFLINSILSLWIIWFLYKTVAFVKAGLWVYLFAFLFLSTAIVMLLQLDSSLAKMALFYTRRFLIHPLLLFVLAAGFYYLKNKNRQL